MASQEAGLLTDIPGIGPVRSRQLQAMGISTVDDFRRASSEQLESLKGITADQIQEMQRWVHEVRGEDDVKDDREDSPNDLSALSSDIQQTVADLLAGPVRHSLKPRLIRQLTILREVMLRVPADLPDVDTDEQQKITKHLRALQRLTGNIHCLTDGDRTHQKVLRERIRMRRKKLGKLI